MGAFRLVLAFCVVLGHGLNLRIPAATADVAVQTFYIVSGFYMALVLSEKYHSTSSFFVNRVLRLYPAYVVVMLATLAHSLVRMMSGRIPGDPGLLVHASYFSPLDLPSKLYVMATNLTLIGQDAALYLKLSETGRSLVFTTHALAADPHVEKFLLVPQAWSLSIELGFYLFAPWLIGRSTRVLLLIVGATIALRLALASVGLTFDPWTYRFFPVELGSFTLGMLLYRSMRKRRSSPMLQRIATAGLLGATLLLGTVPDTWLTRVLFYGYVAWALPLAFALTRQHRIDRYLGELSYPIYLVHLLVVSIALYSGWSGLPLALLIFVLVMGASVALHEIVQKPIDRLRHAQVR